MKKKLVISIRKKRASKPITSTTRVLDIQDYLRSKSERNYILFMLGITTGYRAGDLVGLKIRDVKEAIRNGYFLIFEGKKRNSKNIRSKNRKPREAELLPKFSKILKEYIKDKNDYDLMFTSRKGNSYISVQTVTNILKDAAAYFDLQDITAHSMRKTYAWKIYIDNDCDIVTVMELLGHSSIEETKRYLGIDKEKYHQYNKSLNDFVR